MTKWLSHRMVERGIIKERVKTATTASCSVSRPMTSAVTTFRSRIIPLRIPNWYNSCSSSFMVLRSYTGGYHSDSRIFCYLGSNLVLLVPVYTQAVFYKTSLARLLAVLLVSAGIIFLLSPMHSKNRKLDKEEQKHFGRKARLIAVLELAVLGILWHAGQIPYAYAVYTGICITALFMIVGKAQLWIQSHTENG